MSSRDISGIRLIRIVNKLHDARKPLEGVSLTTLYDAHEAIAICTLT